MENTLNNKMWALGGGKGGVGKSVVTVMLGSILAKKGKKVVLVDADLGGSNLHTLAGIKYPLYTLADFMQRRVENIEDVIMPTPVENLSIICGADDILGLANPKHTQKERLFNHLKKLNADIIMLDLGAGTSFTSMDFFLYAPNKLVVLTPQITSIQNAYGFIKSSMYRLLSRTFSKDVAAMELINRFVDQNDAKVDSIASLKEEFALLEDGQYSKLTECMEALNMGLIVNMVRKTKESNVGHIIQNVANKYLDLSPEYLGYVSYDRVLETSVNNMGKFLVECTDSLAGSCFYDIAHKIIIQNYQNGTSKPQSSHTQSGDNDHALHR